MLTSSNDETMHFRVQMRKQDDGTYTASAQGLASNKPTESQAMNDLKQQLHAATLNGNLAKNRIV